MPSKFRDQIHMYNSVLAFTLLGAKVDESVTGGLGPYSFRIQGELYHKNRIPMSCRRTTATVCITVHS
jgi:hypothetical protein